VKYSLLKNGADSLKAAFQNLELFYTNNEQHYIKDSIIFINHGIEILLKYILKERNPVFMFSDIEKYMLAVGKMKKIGVSNIFEIDANLKTVSLLDALKRVEFLCDIPIPETLKGVILHFNKLRNQIMHYGIELKEEELVELTKKLNFGFLVAVEFFIDHISGIDFLIEFSRWKSSDPHYLTPQDIELLKKEFKTLAIKEEVYAEAIEKLNEIKPKG
jgi:hypothetical protein